MKRLRNEYWDFDPHVQTDARAKLWVDMPMGRPRPSDAPHQQWIEAGHPGRRQQALHTHRAFAWMLREYEDLIDRGEPLTEVLACRFDVSENVIKWLRYCNDAYAEHLSRRFPGDRFEVLCLWLDEVYLTGRPMDAEDLEWFIKAKRFHEWQRGVFGGARDRENYSPGGDWRRICQDVGDALHATKGMRYRLLSLTVYRWRESVGLNVLRLLTDQGANLSPDLVNLALSPSWQDLRDTGFGLGALQIWLRNRNPGDQIDDKGYWLNRLEAAQTAALKRVEQEAMASQPITRHRHLQDTWRMLRKPFERRRPQFAAHHLAQPQSLPLPCQAAIERAQLIRTGAYDPGTLPRSAPYDWYPRRKPRHRR